MRSHSYLNSAEKILLQYKGDVPFASFLKTHFSQNKKFGSRDRKQIAHLCYCFFRMGKSTQKISIQRKGISESILTGLFLCSATPNDILKEMRPEWNVRVADPLTHKLSMINYPSLIEDVFPWVGELSAGIDHAQYATSFFVQPNLYLRMRPGFEEKVKNKLVYAGVSFEEIERGCLSLPNATKIEDVVELDKEAIVQDYNSQRIGEYIGSAILDPKCAIEAWDCCAGSGGKSLLLYDLFRHVDLTVSDTRHSILVNLKKRFAAAGIKNYRSKVVDLGGVHSPLERSIFGNENLQFDLIICDAPCTGSGTWSRTPEQLYFFDETKIEQYSTLQKRIISNVIPYLKRGGFLLYITCSVFKKENENIVNFITKEFNIGLVKMELLRGYQKRADSLFAGLLRNCL